MEEEEEAAEPSREEASKLSDAAYFEAGQVGKSMRKEKQIDQMMDIFGSTESRLNNYQSGR